MMIRVMHVGLGPIGAAVARQVAGRRGFKVVGAVDIDPDKVGRDVGDVVGLDRRLRVKVTPDLAKTLRASKPDVAVLCTSSSLSDVLPQLEQVLKQLRLWDWVQSLPKGLDTPLAGGQSLSAGEAQLLAFARVFLKNPGLVILDEASSRLDPATETLMERAVDRLFAERTGVLIAHRLKTVQRADDILILENGCVVEYGPRVALMNDPASRFYHLLQTGLEEALA